MTVRFQESSVAEMDSLRLYSVLKLRTDVFVVEQGAAYEELDGRDVEPDAQQPLERWYEAFGFTRSGEIFFEDGIPHVPMTRSAA